MQSPTAMLFVLIAVVGAIGSNLVFRVASQNSGWNWIVIFAIGIAIGFSVPLFVTLALARSNANVVFALLSGISCSGLQIAAYFFFREALAPWQIIGIVMICIGAILVSIRSTAVVTQELGFTIPEIASNSQEHMATKIPINNSDSFPQY